MCLSAGPHGIYSSDINNINVKCNGIKIIAWLQTVCMCTAPLLKRERVLNSKPFAQKSARAHLAPHASWNCIQFKALLQRSVRALGRRAPTELWQGIQLKTLLQKSARRAGRRAPTESWQGIQFNTWPGHKVCNSAGGATLFGARL